MTRRSWLQHARPRAALMPACRRERQFPIDADEGPPGAVRPWLAAQGPVPGTAMMGLTGLAGLPTGVQLVAARFREDRCLRAEAIIENAAAGSAIDRLVALER